MKTIVIPDAQRIKIGEDAAKEIASFIHKKAENLGSQTGKTPLNEKHRELLETRLMKIAVGAMTRHDPERTPLVPFVKVMVNRSAFREAAREFNAQMLAEECPWGDDSLNRPVTSDADAAETDLGDLIAEDVETVIRRKVKRAVHEVLDKMEWTEQFALSSLMYKDRTAEHCAERLGISRQTFATFRDEVAVPHFIALWESLDTIC